MNDCNYEVEIEHLHWYVIMKCVHNFSANVDDSVYDEFSVVIRMNEYFIDSLKDLLDLNYSSFSIVINEDVSLVKIYYVFDSF